jgi:hypothetical protein
MKTIPKRYYKAGNHPLAGTVGELKKLLNDLPNDLPIECGFSSCAQLVVYNHGQSDMHLELIEPDEDEKEGDEN